MGPAASPCLLPTSQALPRGPRPGLPATPVPVGAAATLAAQEAGFIGFAPEALLVTMLGHQDGRSIGRPYGLV